MNDRKIKPKKSFLTLMISTCLILATTFVTIASDQADFTNTGAPAVTVGPSYTNVLVMDITLPNSSSVVNDVLITDGSDPSWADDTLTAFDTAEDGMEFYIDQDSSSDYSDGDDIVVQVHSGGTAALSSVGNGSSLTSACASSSVGNGSSAFRSSAIF